jgi:hypothetical protein
LAACIVITCTPTGRSPADASSSRRPASATAAIERANSRAVACGVEHRARVAAQVVVAQRQLVDALEQHRQPVGRRDRGGERVDAGLERLVVQHARAQALEGGDGGLFGGRAAEALLDPLAQRVGGRREHEDRLCGQGVRRPLGQPGEALDERRRLARAGAADDEQRAPAVLDGLELGGGEHFGN